MFTYEATDEDRTNPDYTDPCMEAQGEICSYCCILSKGECSRDIRACDPILVDNRDFWLFYVLIGALVGVICGCPLLAKVYMALIHTRFMKVLISKLKAVESFHCNRWCHLHRGSL